MSQLQRKEVDSGETIFFSAAEKDSERGLTTNSRLFLMLQNKFVCYFSSPSRSFPLTLDHIHNEAKMIVPLNQIYKLNFKKTVLDLYFWLYQNGKRMQKNWTLRMASQELLTEWQQIFDQYSNRSRKGTLERKNTKEMNQYFQSIQPDQAKVEEHPVPVLSREEIELQERLARELAESSLLLKDSRSQSYLEQVTAKTPEVNLREGIEEEERSMPSSTSSKAKFHSQYFSNTFEQKGRFINYFRPYLHPFFDPDRTPGRKELDKIDKGYQQFCAHAKSSVEELIQNKLPALLSNNKKLPSDYNSWIRYEEISDLVIDFGLTELRNVGSQVYVCDQNVEKLILSIFQNMEYIYQVVAADEMLREVFAVPMGCMVTFKGFSCLVRAKIDAKMDVQSEGLYNNGGYSAAESFERLAKAMKVDLAFLQDKSSIILVPRGARKDKFIIAEARKLLPDISAGVLMRKEAYRCMFGQAQKRQFAMSRHDLSKQNKKIGEYLSNRTDELGDILNKMEMYPIGPAQLPSILHSFGVNLNFIGDLYKKVSQSFIKSILKSEAAVQAFKILLNKKIQGELSSGKNKNIEADVVLLLNALLGSGEDHRQLWKVVDLHSQQYFGISVESSEINKGYLYLSLLHILNLEIFPAEFNIQKIFKTDAYVDGIRFISSVKSCNILPAFLTELQSSQEIPIDSRLFMQIVACLQIERREFPYFIYSNKQLYDRILLLMSFFVQPKDVSFSHIHLFQPINQTEKISYFYLQRKMTELRWEIKEKNQRQYILMLCGRLKDFVVKLYGECHPFLSDILELQSLYFMERRSYSQAIEANLLSISNMVQCCGNNQQELKLSNSHFHFGECLCRCMRYGQALQQFRKAKYILEVNDYGERVEYAVLLLKIGKLVLNQHKDGQAYDYFIKALRIYQNSQELDQNWGHLVDILEMLSRCDFRPSAFGQVPFVSTKLAEHCLRYLQKVLSVAEVELCSDQQFVRMFKIVIEPYARRIKREDRALLRSYLIQVSDLLVTDQYESDQVNQRSALLFFKQKISEGSFLVLLQKYFNGAGELIFRLSQSKNTSMARSDVFSQFDRFVKRLVALTGQSYILNTIE